VLELDGGPVSVTGSSVVQSDVGIGPNGKISVTGPSSITGTLYLSSGAQLSKSGSGTIGQVVQNADLSQAINDAQSAATNAAAQPCTQSFGTVTNGTITGFAGQNVICVQNVNLGGGAIVTLTGPAGATFVINVTGTFTLGGNAQIAVGGGVQSADVLYNVIGIGQAVAFGGGSSVDGSLLAPQRKISLNGGTVDGGVFSRRDINITSGSVVSSSATATVAAAATSGASTAQTLERSGPGNAMIPTPVATPIGRVTGVTFRILHADCGTEPSVFDFFINNTPIGSVASSASCECESVPQEVAFADPATLALVDAGLCNAYRMTVSDGGAAVGLGQVQILVERADGNLEGCLFDGSADNTSPTCDNRSLCDGPAFSDGVAAVAGMVCPVCGSTPQSAAGQQRDLDGDRIADACDDADAVLTIRHARVHHDPTRFEPNGSIVLQGDLALAAANDTFDATRGIALRVTDGSRLDTTLVFQAEDCQRLATGAVSCRSPDGHAQGSFVPYGDPPTRYGFALRLDHLALSGPFQSSLTVRLTDDPPVPVEGIDRVGAVGDCVVTRSQMRCRQP